VYAESKVLGEGLVNRFRAQGLRTAVLRFSSVYGSAQDHVDRVVPAFCRAAIRGDSLRVDGLENVFDFTHVNDTVDGIIKVITKLSEGVLDLPPIHLTTGVGTRLLDLVFLIQKLLNKKVFYHQSPCRTYDVQRFYGNPSLAKNILGWEAKVTLSTGIKNLLEQYENH